MLEISSFNHQNSIFHFSCGEFFYTWREGRKRGSFLLTFAKARVNSFSWEYSSKPGSSKCSFSALRRYAFKAWLNPITSAIFSPKVSSPSTWWEEISYYEHLCRGIVLIFCRSALPAQIFENPCFEQKKIPEIGVFAGNLNFCLHKK